MEATLGMSPFGQDELDPKADHKRPFVAAVKQAMANAVSEADAYATGYAWTKLYITRQVKGAGALGLPSASIDTLDLGTRLIAHLLHVWFGVAYGGGVAEEGGLDPQQTPVRCPGHFLSLARSVFSAYPNETAKKLAKGHGGAVKNAVNVWTAAAQPRASAPVLYEVWAALQAAQPALADAEMKGTVANVMLGLPATLLGSWFKLLRELIAKRRLWALQLQLLPVAAIGPVAHADAQALLHDAIIEGMAADPVADGIWRTARQAVKLGEVDIQPEDIVWLGLGSALSEKKGDLPAMKNLLFGGAPGQAPHACPGRDMAIGVLLGALAALLTSGELATTPSPTVLSLKPLS
jgi:hypothetical protein